MKNTIKINLTGSVEAANYYDMLHEIIEKKDGLKIFQGESWVVITGEDDQLTALRRKLP
ncbi:hypothetical protein KAR91_75165 [Candidatus Pacearchaeota archaeon]|nr:hypothetical protein [Candidatus Pacearchaeota archaeon]